MSAAAHRPIRLRLGTRTALLGGLLVVAVWLAAAEGWRRERQAALDAEPVQLRQRLGEELARTLEDRLSLPPLGLEQAVSAARARASELAALRETRRGRRLVDEPDLPELVRQQLELALAEPGGFEAAWLRRGARFDWTRGGSPSLREAAPMDGPCLLHVPGGQVRLARCRERVLTEGAQEVVTGAARAVATADLPARTGPVAWALCGEGDGGVVLDAAGWPGAAEDPTPPEALVWYQLERRALAAGWSLQESWRSEAAGVRVLVAAAPAPRLDASGLLRGEAGPLTGSWRRWALRTGAVALAALLFFLVLGWRVNAAFRPVVAAARNLGADDLDVRVPVRRWDEIGALAAVLNDLGTSLRHARRGWEREARLAAWRDVARGLAHEIKNPLTPIQGTVENLMRWRREEPARFDEKFEARMGTILAEVEQLSRLASAFSDFAKLPPPQPEPADLNRLLREVGELQAGEREGLRLELRLDEGLGPVAFDAGQVRQVATNLVKNAREALGEGGGTVRLESGTHGGGAWFAVSDDGPGVDEASLEKLFVPGWSTRKAEGGSGLGLWLCHRIVLEHDGTITASRSELGGLRIRVTLPSE